MVLCVANYRVPYWADPLEAWGEARKTRGTARTHSQKYEEALKYAPKLKQLKEAHEALTKQKIWSGYLEADTRDRLFRVDIARSRSPANPTPLNSAVSSGTTVHGRPHFAKLSVREG